MPLFALRLELPFFWLETHLLPDLYSKSAYFDLNRTDGHRIALYLELLSLDLDLSPSHVRLRNTAGSSERDFYNELILESKTSYEKTSQAHHHKRTLQSETLSTISPPFQSVAGEQDNHEQLVESDLMPVHLQELIDGERHDLHRIYMVAFALKHAWLSDRMSWSPARINNLIVSGNSAFLTWSAYFSHLAAFTILAVMYAALLFWYL